MLCYDLFIENYKIFTRKTSESKSISIQCMMIAEIAMS